MPWAERRLTLVSSQSFPSGLVQLRYNVERAARDGAAREAP